MYISKVFIRNFRVFDSEGITVSFKKGVNAVISENNCGKTALIDALRLAFSATSYRKDIYFSFSDFHMNSRGIRSNEASIDVYMDEVSPDFFEIWDPENPTKGEFHVRFYVVPIDDNKEKIRFRIWGGPIEGNAVSSETLDAIKIAYLSALRDAESEMKPARGGRLAALFGSIVKTDEAKEHILSAVKQANTSIEKQVEVKRLREIINSNLSVLEQDLLRQKVGVGLVEPQFESIAAALRAWISPRWVYVQNDNPILEKVKALYTENGWSQQIETVEAGVYVDVWPLEDKDESDEIRVALQLELSKKFEIMQNGLGYNNLLYMAAVLGDIETATSGTLFSLLLVEEPEAHLHPQLQELVHDFFEKNSNKENVQVIYTSHSPTLVSRIGIDKVVLLYEDGHKICSLSFSDSNLGDVEKFYLERYLDVTKSQMLFAKGIVFVEGISEALLLPCMAKQIECPLDKYAVTVVNVDGVSFEPFSKLLCFAKSPHKQTIRATIITDDDRCADKALIDEYVKKEIDYDCNKSDLADVILKLDKGIPSDRYKKINELCSSTHITLYGAKKTLEYELSLTEINVDYVLSSIIDAFPVAGKTLYDVVKGLTNINEKAACIWLFMREHSKGKAQVAQALSRRIENRKIMHKRADGAYEETETSTHFDVPEYIKKAILHVTKEKNNGSIDRGTK